MTYDSLAQVYDILTGDFDYGLWSEKYIDMLRSKARDVKEICDAGCGTGKLMLEMAKRGINVIGVDISEGMLREAQNKAMEAGIVPRLLNQDMRQMALPHKVDAVTCACDGLNYLRNEKGAAAFFARAFDSVKSGGAFAFDFSSEKKLLQLAKTGLFAEEREETAYIMFCGCEGKLLSMDMCAFLKRENGLYERFEETHVQRIWQTDEVVTLLEQAGFTDISAEQQDLRGFGGDRVFVYCKRP
ncbi:MAG: class I SAM-dependent methyltransferase [Clostridia bacterium]|nr:class I SAM-dependent methyltransferase [Clostridia bacterium]